MFHGHSHFSMVYLNCHYALTPFTRWMVPSPLKRTIRDHPSGVGGINTRPFGIVTFGITTILDTCKSGLVHSGYRHGPLLRPLRIDQIVGGPLEGVKVLKSSPLKFEVFKFLWYTIDWLLNKRGLPPGPASSEGQRSLHNNWLFKVLWKTFKFNVQLRIFGRWRLFQHVTQKQCCSGQASSE